LGAKGFGFDSLWVDEPDGRRWSAALELLREGRAIIFKGVGLTIAEPGVLLESVPAWVDVAGMPRSIVERRLTEAEDAIDALRSNADFASLTSGRETEAQLVDESYGWVYATRRNGRTKFSDFWSRHHPR
jgi:hypothetical protein